MENYITNTKGRTLDFERRVRRVIEDKEGEADGGTRRVRREKRGRRRKGKRRRVSGGEEEGGFS